MTEFDRKNQPVAITETVERVHFEGRTERKTVLEVRPVLGEPIGATAFQSGADPQARWPFSDAAPAGLYRYELEGVEELAAGTVVRVRFEPVRPDEGTFTGSAWIDPVTAEPVRVRGSAVRLPVFLDRFEMLVDYGPAETGHNQVRRVTADIAGGLGFISKHYRLEAELSDYRLSDADEYRSETQPSGIGGPSSEEFTSEGTTVMSGVVGVGLALVGAGLAAFTLALAGCWSWKRRWRAALRDGSRLARTARGPIEYATAGEGQPLLVIHGGMGGYNQALGLGALVNRYAGATGFLVLAPSRPGYLRTPAEVGLTPQEQADALAAWLDQLGIEQVGVFAGSSGGPVALQFALRHPHRLGALVLFAAITQRCTFGDRLLSESVLQSGPGRAFLDLRHWLLYLWCRMWPTGLVRMIVRRMTTPSVSTAEVNRRVDKLGQLPDQVHTVQELFCSMMPASWQLVGALNDEKQIACLPDYPLEDLRVPTLLVYGRDDCVGPGFAGAEQTAGRIPGAQLLAVEQCGHFLLAGEFVPGVYSAVAAFLHRHAPGVEPELPLAVTRVEPPQPTIIP
ncbi:MAG: alpha/beta hydrolase [Zavarzinella sp.]|nr:alpha/beta hydrolase [Zavarzinella sp.]